MNVGVCVCIIMYMHDITTTGEVTWRETFILWNVTGVARNPPCPLHIEMYTLLLLKSASTLMWLDLLSKIYSKAGYMHWDRTLTVGKLQS